MVCLGRTDNYPGNSCSVPGKNREPGFEKIWFFLHHYQNLSNTIQLLSHNEIIFLKQSNISIFFIKDFFHRMFACVLVCWGTQFAAHCPSSVTELQLRGIPCSCLSSINVWNNDQSWLLGSEQNFQVKIIFDDFWTQSIASPLDVQE